jgi:hypothetical protein
LPLWFCLSSTPLPALLDKSWKGLLICDRHNTELWRYIESTKPPTAPSPPASGDSSHSTPRKSKPVPRPVAANGIPPLSQDQAKVAILSMIYELVSGSDGGEPMPLQIGSYAARSTVELSSVPLPVLLAGLMARTFSALSTRAWPRRAMNDFLNAPCAVICDVHCSPQSSFVQRQWLSLNCRPHWRNVRKNFPLCVFSSESESALPVQRLVELCS